MIEKFEMVGDELMPTQFRGADRFVVDDLAKAEWCMKKITALQKDIAEKEEQAERMKKEYAASVDMWLSNECENAKSNMVFFQSLLEPFVQAEIEKSEGKKKSIKLPSGTCGYRKPSVVFKLNGEELGAKSESLLAWVHANYADYIKRSETVDWNGLKGCLVPTDDGRVMIDGEILEGFTAEVPESTFYVKGQNKWTDITD